MITYTDRVLEKLDTHIGQFEPERGGALMALPNSNIVVDFLPDPDGLTSGSSYVPSEELTDRVQAVERNQGLSFCGVVHSHPGAFDQPSAQDDVAFRRGLDINPHLARFVSPIITMDGHSDKASEFQRMIGQNARLTSYVAYRSNDLVSHSPLGRRWFANPNQDISDPSVQSLRLRSKDSHSREEVRKLACSEPSAEQDRDDRQVVRERHGLVRLVRTKIDVMPLNGQIRLLRKWLEAKLEMPVSGQAGPVVQLGGVHCLSESIQFEGGDILIIVPPTFPFTAPVVVAGSGQDSRQIPIPWEMDHGIRPESLATIVIQHLGEEGLWRLT